MESYISYLGINLIDELLFLLFEVIEQTDTMFIFF